jgi:hypothetical protein
MNERIVLMDVVKVVREAWSVVRTERSLWFFGLFLAGAGAGGGANGEGGSGSPGEVPTWVWPLVAAGLVLAVVGVVVSEAAAIEGVVRARQREVWSIRAGLKTGLRSFRVVAGIKLLVGLAALVALVFVGAPWALHFAGGLSLPAAIAIGAPLALVAAPVALSGYFVYHYALRFAVLEGEGALDSLREGLAFLRGRVKESIKLLIGQAVASSNKVQPSKVTHQLIGEPRAIIVFHSRERHPLQ